MLDDERVVPDDKNPVYRRHLERYRFAKNFVRGKTVLSVACGVGYGEYLLATEGGASRVTGVDYSAEAIAFAGKNYHHDNLEFIVDDARDLSGFRDGSFEVIVSFETIEHLEDDAGFLRESKRILRPGGILLISTPNKAYSYKSLFSRRPLASFHVREYHRREFTSLLGKYFGHVDLYGQKIILNRSVANLPLYFWRKFIKGDLAGFEKDEFSVKPYPQDHRLASCSFLAVCGN